MNLNEEVISKKLVFSGKVFDVYKEKVVLPNGNKADREIVKHSGGVCVIPVEGNYVYMVRQFRKGVNDVCLEFPAGKLEKNENHYDAGLRELKEEIGASAKKYTYIGKIYPTPAYCSEIIHLYIAEGLIIGSQSPDEDEFLSVEKIKTDDLFDMIEKGKLCDSKTIIGAYKLKDYLLH